MTTIRHVVFDLGQVLIGYDMEAPYRRLIPDATARQRFFDEVAIHDWNLEQDRGRTWPDAEAALIAEFPHYSDLIRAFRAHWWEMIPGALDENVAIVEALIAKGIDVTALTNWAPDTFEEASRRFPILSRFRGITVSGHVRMVKPELAIYRHHAAAFGLDPATTLFFDDNPKNVAAARRAGWHAEQYVSTDNLRADLARFGLTP
jgi:2-haloacid dehalogenase